MLFATLIFLIVNRFQCQVLIDTFSADSTMDKYYTWDVSGSYVVYLKDNSIYIHDLVSNTNFNMDAPSTGNIAISSSSNNNNFFTLQSYNTDVTIVAYSLLTGEKVQSGKTHMVTNNVHMKLSGSFIYLFFDESILQIYSLSMKKENEFSSSIRYFPDKGGLYGFSKNKTDMFLSMQNNVGTTTLWNISVPFCSQKIFFVATTGMAYFGCSSNNLITQINTVKGQLGRGFFVQSGPINEMALFVDRIYILYDNTKIVQYSVFSDFVNSFSLSNRRTTQTTSMKATSKNLFIGSCLNSSVSLVCLNPSIYQYSSNFPIAETVYQFLPQENNLKNSSISVTHETFQNPDFQVTFSKQPTYTGIEFHYSYISPVSFMQNDEAHFVYYSGGLNPRRASYGDNQ